MSQAMKDGRAKKRLRKEASAVLASLTPDQIEVLKIIGRGVEVRERMVDLAFSLRPLVSASLDGSQVKYALTPLGRAAFDLIGEGWMPSSTGR